MPQAAILNLKAAGPWELVLWPMMQCCEIRGWFNGQTNTVKQGEDKARKGRVEKTDPAPQTTHWPPLHGLPYGLLHELPYGLPLRTTLKNQPNSFYGVQKYIKLTCSSFTIITAQKTAAIFFSYISRPSLFHFAPFFTGRPPYWGSEPILKEMNSFCKQCFLS